MDGKSTSNESGIPINAATILALLTLIGGVLLVTRPLSSDRPIASSGETNEEYQNKKLTLGYGRTRLALPPI